MAKQGHSEQTETTAGHKVHRSRGRRKPGGGGRARFGLANCAYGVPDEHLTELATDIDLLSKALHGSEPRDIDRINAMIARMADDLCFAAARRAFQEIAAHVRAGRWTEAREIAVEVFNVAWDRSQEYWVGKDAFIRRVRGKNFKPLSHADPMTSDRAAALARIMQADGAELEDMLSGTRQRTELVIEVAGEFELIRLVKG